MSEPESEPLTTTVEAAARLLGIGRSTAYKAAASGELPTIRIGNRILVPVAELKELLTVAPGAAAVGK